MRTLARHPAVLLCLFAVVLAGGCRDAMPHSFTWPAGGDVVPTHPEPPEGGYYTNWDPYAVKLEVVPVEDVNPVQTQHILIATVLDEEGNALPNRRVEWVISEGGVGDIIEVDESGWRASRGYKVTNKLAVTHTNNYEHVLDRGNDDPADDIHIQPGQTWCVITSPIEGTTFIVAYAPGIYDWENHKVFVKKHWFDVTLEPPPNAVNRIGTDHVMTAMVMRNSDGTPLADHRVTYEILSGPAGRLDPGGGQTASLITGADGNATVTLRQVTPLAGSNTIEIKAYRPAGMGDTAHGELLIGRGIVEKVWLAPEIKITKSAPPTALVGDTFSYNIVVSNPGPISALNVVVKDSLPDGISYVSSTPQASTSGRDLSWSLGTLDAGSSLSVRVMVKGQRRGTFTNPATVSAADGLSDRAEATTRIGAAELSLDKQGPSEVVLCDSFEYTLIVRNVGDAAATNVRIEDTLPDGLRTAEGLQTATFNVGTLQPDEARTVRFGVSASRTGTFADKAMASADRGLTASASLRTIVRQPVLKVDKTGPAKRFLGQSVTYNIKVTNTGDVATQDVILVDSVPAGTSFRSASDGGTLQGGTVRWNLGSLKAGASRSVSVILTADRVGTVSNDAAATAHCAKDSDVAVTEIVGIPAILLEAIDLADPIAVGANETYRITVTNQGSAADTNVVITCTMAGQQSFVSADGPTDASVKGKTVTFAPLRKLAVGQQVVYEVVVKAVSAGDVRFAVQLESDQMDSPVMETESTRQYVLDD